MFRYLGETKNPEQYRSLLADSVKQSENEDEIDIFSIENVNGKFEAFPATLDDEKGFIYSIDKFDIYEFCSEDEVSNMNIKETVKIANTKRLDYDATFKAILEVRDDVTKEVEEHDIQFFNFKGYKEFKKARKANYNGENGFIYQNQEYSGILDKNVKKDYFLSAKNVYENKLVAKPKMHTPEELKVKEKEKLKEEYELTKNIFKERNIKINNYPDFEGYELGGRYRINSLVNKLKTLEKEYGVRIENQKVDFQQFDKQLSELIYTNKVEAANKYMKAEYGFTVEASLSEQDEFVLNLLGKNNKKLSTLKVDGFTFEEDYEHEITEPEWGEVIDKEEVEVTYGYIDIENTMEDDDRQVTVWENNRPKPVPESTYEKVYKGLDKYAFTKNEVLADLIHFENNQGITLEVKDIDFNDRLAFINLIKREIESDPELIKQLRELKEAERNKNKNKQTRKI